MRPAEPSADPARMFAAGFVFVYFTGQTAGIRIEYMYFIQNKERRMITVKKYVCDVCGYIYDPELGDPDNGIAAGTAFEDLPEDWVCPLCSVGKDQFSVTE